MLSRLLIVAALILTGASAQAATVRATVHSVSADGIGPSIGVVTFEDTKWGLMATPNLSSLPAGVHGLHIHEKAACGPAAHGGKPTAGLAAGGHYDPSRSGKHLGPYNSGGHAGDLPPLIVNVDGKTATPVLAPRLKVKDLRGHAVMIHAGGDNYSDVPVPLGGGGGRIACGAIQ